MSGARVAGAPVAGAVEESGGSWLRATRVVAFDHSLGRAWTLSADHDAEAWAAAVSALVGAREPVPMPVRADETRVAQARHDPQEYAALIERCRDLIRAGIAYQLCLTTRFTVRERMTPWTSTTGSAPPRPPTTADSCGSATARC